MSSIPAPEINNPPAWDRLALLMRLGKAYEFGFLRIANVLLAAIAIAAIGAFLFVGIAFRKAAHEIATFKPYIVRVNDVGKAETIFFHDFSTMPQAPEVISSLEEFTTDFFTRMKDRINEYWNSKYKLSQELQAKTYQDDQKTQWISKVQSGGESVEARWLRTNLVTLTPQGGYGYVDFIRTYYSNGQPLDVTESDTASYTFKFAPEIKGTMLNYNPLGLVITSYHVTENPQYRKPN